MGAPTSTKLIKVTGVSQYSVYSGTQRYSFNKSVNSTMFQKGNTYSVTVKTGSKGGEYIDAILNNLGDIAGDATPSPSTSALNPSTNQASSFKKSVDSGLSKEEWAAKDVRISRSGVIQAAVQAVATHSKDVADLEVKAIALAEVMLQWVNQKTTAQVSQ